jgi:hypothetical protein
MQKTPEGPLPWQGNGALEHLVEPRLSHARQRSKTPQYPTAEIKLNGPKVSPTFVSSGSAFKASAGLIFFRQSVIEK